MTGRAGVEIAFLDTGPFGQVVNDGFVDGDVIVDKWDAFVDAAASKDRDTC